ncbi:hypothetical protein D1159_00890 [Pseudoflavonifractor sp. 524-17]|uniref:hypothetical protein n=1 Tax=Pseudoflavonifractor sp. 524-17 TaxID=2304577 RepID=UPI00137AB7BB|nr:hypothetical protein [Pseudoflavonifractor sp. 524-17]NCE63169.1 hypothetical protein [Pseudoflavonifractor sp. 524-17]
MKRILTVVSAVLMVVSFAACGGASGGEVQKPSNVSADNPNVPENSNDSNNETKITIEETVLVDKGGVKITAKSLSTDEIFGAELKLLIENNSGKDLTIQCRNASVNGYMVEPMMSVDIVNGRKANDAITFMDSDFDACGITAIEEVELSFTSSIPSLGMAL